MCIQNAIVSHFSLGIPALNTLLRYIWDQITLNGKDSMSPFPLSLYRTWSHCANVWPPKRSRIRQEDNSPAIIKAFMFINITVGKKHKNGGFQPSKIYYRILRICEQWDVWSSITQLSHFQIAMRSEIARFLVIYRGLIKRTILSHTVLPREFLNHVILPLWPFLLSEMSLEKCLLSPNAC